MSMFSAHSILDTACSFMCVCVCVCATVCHCLYVFDIVGLSIDSPLKPENDVRYLPGTLFLWMKCL